MHDDVFPFKEKMRAVRTDPIKSGLVFIEIPLNVSPDREWKECFEHTSTWSKSFHEAWVKESLIELRADKLHPENDVEVLLSRIREANECYRKVMKEWEMEKKRGEE